MKKNINIERTLSRSLRSCSVRALFLLIDRSSKARSCSCSILDFSRFCKARNRSCSCFSLASEVNFSFENGFQDSYFSETTRLTHKLSRFEFFPNKLVVSQFLSTNPFFEGEAQQILKKLLRVYVIYNIKVQPILNLKVRMRKQNL